MNRRHTIFIVFVVLLLGILACNLGNTQPDTPATVQAVYDSLTAEAELGTLAATNTPNRTATPTTTLTATATPPSERTGNGNNLTVAQCSGTMTVDASAEDWDSQSDVRPFALVENTFGQSEWLGTEDASAVVRLCWTTEAIFLFAEVVDDVHVQTQSGGTAWQGDEIEIMFDRDIPADYDEREWNDDDMQIGLSPGNFVDLPASAVEYHPNDVNDIGINLSVVRPIASGGDYILEARIPWTILREEPEVDEKFGLCIALSDNDHIGTAQQDSMVSHCTRLVVPDPTTYITITLGQ